MNNENKNAAKAVQNQHLKALPKLELEMPVMLNKIILTEKLMYQLNLLQTGGGAHCKEPEYNNDDVISAKEFLTKTMLYLIQQIADKGPSETRIEEDELIIGLRWLYDVIGDFEVPKEFSDVGRVG